MGIKYESVYGRWEIKSVLDWRIGLDCARRDDGDGNKVLQ
jgi:hypothetical protein